MTSENQELTSRKKGKTWILLILGLIILSVAGYFYLQNKAEVDYENLFSTYYVQPAEIDNMRGAGPFRNDLDHAYYLFSQNDFEGALNKMQGVLKNDPSNIGYSSMGHYISAHCYIHLKDYEMAKKELSGSMHFGVRVNLLLIELLEGKISEEEYIERKTLKF